MEATKAKRAIFRIDGVDYTLAGWTFGDHWNGWACPAFEREAADLLIKGLQAQPNWRGAAYFMKSSDSFVIIEADDANGRMEWSGHDILTEEGSRHVYSIGSNYWCW